MRGVAQPVAHSLGVRGSPSNRLAPMNLTVGVSLAAPHIGALHRAHGSPLIIVSNDADSPRAGGAVKILAPLARWWSRAVGRGACSTAHVASPVRIDEMVGSYRDARPPSVNLAINAIVARVRVLVSGINEGNLGDDVRIGAGERPWKGRSRRSVASGSLIGAARTTRGRPAFAPAWRRGCSSTGAAERCSRHKEGRRRRRTARGGDRMGRALRPDRRKVRPARRKYIWIGARMCGRGEGGRTLRRPSGAFP